jgi:mannosyltransferase OCH1-like enzyme
MIPKIIHQIYWNFKNNNADMPEKWKQLQKNCKTLYENNGWKYILWNRSMGNKFIRHNFPWLWKNYSLSINIERVDILRYAILYIYGGMYLDLDTVCNKIFIPDTNDKVILPATLLHDTFVLNNFFSINNNILLSVPRHRFWKRLLDNINNTYISDFLPKFIYISMKTGPYMLQNTYENYFKKEDITIYKKLYKINTKSKKKSYFTHISTKSWIDVFDGLHLVYFLFLFLFITIFLFIYLCRK